MTAVDRSTLIIKSEIKWWVESLPDLVHHQGTKDSVSSDGRGEMTWHCMEHLKPSKVSSMPSEHCASKRTLVW